jgi:hypothetical protein
VDKFQALRNVNHRARAEVIKNLSISWLHEIDPCLPGAGFIFQLSNIF